jgi:hypothetical protein
MNERAMERVRAPKGGAMEISNETAGPWGEQFRGLEELAVRRGMLGWPGGGAVDADEPAFSASVWPTFDELELDDAVHLA